MIETEMQQLIIDAVKRRGGFAVKLSNRFLVGVVDLLVKLPRYPAGLLECKRYDYAGKEAVAEFDLAVTGPQQRFLRDADAAGMPCGVASFTQRRNFGVRSLGLAIYTLAQVEGFKYVARADDHAALGDAEERAGNAMTQVERWLETWEKHK